MKNLIKQIFERYRNFASVLLTTFLKDENLVSNILAVNEEEFHIDLQRYEANVVNFTKETRNIKEAMEIKEKKYQCLAAMNDEIKSMIKVVG